jgi:hypothetical protein
VMVLTGSVLAFMTILVQAALVLSGLLTPWTLFVPGFFVTFSQGISLPYAQVGAMGTVPRIAGTAAGVGVFMQNMGGAVFTQLYGLFADGTPMPMIAVVLCSAILCLAAGAVPLLCGPDQSGDERDSGLQKPRRSDYKPGDGEESVRSTKPVDLSARRKPGLLENHVRTLLANHDRCGVGVAGHDSRHY